MDPYLENPGLWPDVHHGLISEIQAALNRSLRPRYYVRVEESVYISDEGDEVHEAYLEIVDRALRQVVTVIEVLSPANKLAGSRGRASVEQKRKEVLSSLCHWVEIDLLRDGPRILAREGVPPCEYLVHVAEVGRGQELVWPIRLAQRLPAVSIPLRPEEPPTPLDLQSVLDSAYDRAAYDLEVDYQSDPTPRLPVEWNEWSNRLLASKGLRQS